MNPPLRHSDADDASRHRLAWAEYPADLTSPVRFLLTLRAAGHQVCLLESAEGPERLARWSFVGVDPVARFRGGPHENRLVSADGVESYPGSPAAALRRLARRHPAPSPPPDLPPFCGGWIGWFAYEWIHALEPRVPQARDDSWDVPQATFDLYRTVVAFDHARSRLFVLRACPNGRDEFDEAAREIETIAGDLGRGRVVSGPFELLDEAPKPCTSRADFLRNVGVLKEAIAEGEIFQAVLSQRFEQRFEGDPFALYRALRLTNPSPHMFFFEADGLALAGSSPERLVSVVGGRGQVVPIAGTRRRDPDPDRDDALGHELMRDPKERAEHDMLVDLARNDLGRVARFGTVAVREHATLERFARVQHLVSRVECELATGNDALDTLAACFPAGTVSGAPKVRAMELISELEGTTRGPYAGAFGYLDGRGNLDAAIAIRTIAMKDGVLSIQAGAGIVYDSDPEAEYRETLHKADALFEAVKLAATPSFGGGPQPPVADTPERTKAEASR